MLIIGLHGATAGLRDLPGGDPADDAVPAVAQRRLDPRRAAFAGPHRHRRGGTGDRVVRPLRDRRQLRRRPVVVFAILVVINFIVVTKGAGTHLRGRRALHPRRDARQADGDRRRPERRPDRREEGSPAGATSARRTSTARWTVPRSSCGRRDRHLSSCSSTSSAVSAVGVAQARRSSRRRSNNATPDDDRRRLVAQMPALLISVAVAVVVSRAAAGTIGERSRIQGSPAEGARRDRGRHRASGAGPGHAAPSCFCSSPGGWKAVRRGCAADPEGQRHQAASRGRPGPTVKATWDDLRPVTPSSSRSATGLIALVDKDRQGDLLARIRASAKFASEDGFHRSARYIRDNLDLKPSAILSRHAQGRRRRRGRGPG